MKCPNCGKEMYKDFCMHCGYMANGNYIKMNNENTTTDFKTILGKDYYKIEEGKLSFSSLLFGPLYLCYRTYLYLGLFLGLIDLLSFYGVAYINNHYLTSLNMPIYIILIIYLLLNRAFWLVVNNRIYLFLLKRKIDDINKNHNFERESYINGVITKSRSKLFVSVIVYVFVGIILFCLLLK